MPEIVHSTVLERNKQASTRNRCEGRPRTVKEVEIVGMMISFFLMIIISTSLTVRGQPSSRFHVEPS